MTHTKRVGKVEKIQTVIEGERMVGQREKLPNVTGREGRVN